MSSSTHCESLGGGRGFTESLLLATTSTPHHPDFVRRPLSPSPPSPSLPLGTTSSNISTTLLTPSPPSDPGPSSLRSMDAAFSLPDAPLAYSRNKAFPHNADLLGGRSESRRSLLSRTSNPAVEEESTRRAVGDVDATGSAPPPRQRRRTLLESSRTSHPHRDPPHLAAFEQNSFRGEGIHELGTSMQQHQPTAYRPRPDYDHDLPSFTLSSSSSDEDAEPVRLALPSPDSAQISLIPPRIISANRRIPTPPTIRTPPPLVRPPPLSELMFMYGNTGDALAENEAAADPLPVPAPTVPPPRSSAWPSWRGDEGPLNFSPERIREHDHTSRFRFHHPQTNAGIVPRSEALSNRLARLDALRTESAGHGSNPPLAPRFYGTLFGAPSNFLSPTSRSSAAPTNDAMDVDDSSPSTGLLSDIGRWNDNVQEALARRVSAERGPPPATNRRYREGFAPYSRQRQASGPTSSNLAYEQPAASGNNDAEFGFPYAHWGEIPIDTATTGLHDIYQPRAVAPTPVSLAVQQNLRRVRLPRAFESPEQRAPDQPPATSGLTPRSRGAQNGDPTMRADWLDVSRDVLGWRLPDVMRGSIVPSRHSGASSRVDNNLNQSFGTRLAPRWDEVLPRRTSGTQSSTSTGADSEVHMPWEGPSAMYRTSDLERITTFPILRDSAGAHRHMHDRPNICRGMQMKPGMTEADKLLVARALGRSLGRWGPEVRRKAARAVVEQVEWGKIGQREGMEIDVNCSICHDEVSLKLHRSASR